MCVRAAWVKMPAVALTFELVSHIAYLPALFLAIYAGRGQIAQGIVWVLVFSMHYHVCLDSDVCVTSLRRAGSFDYFAGYNLGAIIANQLTGAPHDWVSGNTMTITFLLVMVIDDLYLNYWAFFLVTIVLTYQVLVMQPLFGLHSNPCRNPGVQPMIYALLAVSYVLIAFPLDPGSYWYSVFHPPWHVSSGVSLFLYLLVLTRPIVIHFSGWIIHYKIRRRREIIADAIKYAPYSEFASRADLRERIVDLPVRRPAAA